MSVAVGVDWAMGRWLCLAQRERKTVPTPDTYESIAEIWRAYNSRTGVTRRYIDIPIGLPNGSEERTVDGGAGRISTATQTSSAFHSVTRLRQTHSKTQTHRVELPRKLTKRTASVSNHKPMLFASKSSKSIPSLASSRSDTDTIYEAHPELCFRALHGTPPRYI
jgi:predicted RNase H-like nuclease